MSVMARSLSVYVLFALAFSGGQVFAEWPSLYGIPPLGVVIQLPNERLQGEEGRPSAQLHGPDGLVDIPTVNRDGHRKFGRSTVRFPRPLFQGKRLDWCSAPAHECGPSAAQHFCEASGFRRVIEAVQENDVGLYADTQQIASGLSCTGRGCHGFLRITCTKS